jgi:hypothetical protein
MQQNTIIEWSTAIQQAKEEEERRVIERNHYLQDFKENDLSILDYADLIFYSEMTDISPNELRRLHPMSNNELILETFIGDETDDIFNFF